jgi:hypothetical protein
MVPAKDYKKGEAGVNPLNNRPSPSQTMKKLLLIKKLLFYLQVVMVKLAAILMELVAAL